MKAHSKDDHESDGREDDVHDHAGRDYQHPSRDRFAVICTGILGLRIGIQIVLPEHFHVAAKRDPIQSIFGFAESQGCTGSVDFGVGRRVRGLLEL